MRRKWAKQIVCVGLSVMMSLLPVSAVVGAEENGAVRMTEEVQETRETPGADVSQETEGLSEEEKKVYVQEASGLY